MLRSRLRLALAGCFTAALVLAAPGLGCKDKDLIETTVPAEGLELRYDLKTGATFEGQVDRRETINSRGQSMSRSINFTVQLIVLGVDESGNARVAATIDNINLNWNIPGLPISMKDFNDRAKRRLQRMTIRFGVQPNGTVFDIPAAPPELDEAEVSVLESVIDGLTSAFFVLPDERLAAAGQGWEDVSTRGREGKLGKYTVETTRGKLAGVFERRGSAQQLVKLSIDTDKSETTKTKDGSTEIRTRGDTTVLFDAQDRYLASVESTQRRTQGPTITTVNFKAHWQRSIAGTDAPGTMVEPQVQSISDPCDDDYVGPDDCLDPCNSNYMGEEQCAAEGEAGVGAGEASEGEASVGEASVGEAEAED
jgi:hypothetical protein